MALSGLRAEKELVDSSVTLKNKDYGQVEDIHLSLAHIISYLVKEGINDG